MIGAPPADLSSGWAPTVENRVDAVSEAAARSLHDLLDREGCAPRIADPLPLLWHWLAFLPQAPQRDLSPDGHPRTGGFLPPTVGRSRVHAGGRVSSNGSATVGQTLSRQSTVADVSTKQGRTGPMMLVEVAHTLTGDGAPGIAVTDEQNLIYRDLSPAGTSTSTAGRSHSQWPASDSPEWTWGRRVIIDPALLFRFSALTYNAHRIHYDRDFATGQEGYPGLVVHGPLQAVLIADAVSRALPDHAATTIAYRAVAPAFDDEPLEIRLMPLVQTDEETGTRAVIFSGGRPTMTAVVS